MLKIFLLLNNSFAGRVIPAGGYVFNGGTLCQFTG